MEIINIEIIAAEGCKVARKDNCQYKEDYFTRGTLFNGENIDSFVELPIDQLPPERPLEPIESYDEKVNRLIRERYSESAEFALLRQRDSKPQEFAEYNEFCEACKRKAKEE